MSSEFSIFSHPIEVLWSFFDFSPHTFISRKNMPLLRAVNEVTSSDLIEIYAQISPLSFSQPRSKASSHLLCRNWTPKLTGCHRPSGIWLMRYYSSSLHFLSLTLFQLLLSARDNYGRCFLRFVGVSKAWSSTFGLDYSEKGGELIKDWPNVLDG